jgi:hypothetical protein
MYISRRFAFLHERPQRVKTRMHPILCSIVIVAGLLAGCSAPVEPVASGRSAVAQKDPSERSSKEGRAADRGARERIERPSSKGEGASGTGEHDPGRPSRAGGRMAPSSLSDPRNDLDQRGDAPGYVDLTSVRLRDTGEALRVTVAVRGPFPTEMPDTQSNALVVVGFTRGGDEYLVQASASTGGWSPTLSRNGRDERYRGRFAVAESRMTFSLPWAGLGGRGRLRWSVDSSWTRSSLLDTFYAFDRAPQFERRPYPGR